MTDYIDDSRVLPSSVRYSQITPLAVEGKALQKKMLPISSGPYTNNNPVCRINISSGSEFLDTQNSYLKFTLTNSDAQTCQVDSSGHSLIKRIRIVARSGGPDIEVLLNYNQLAGMLSDLQASADHRQSIHGYLSGYGNGGNLTALTTTNSILADGLVNHITGVISDEAKALINPLNYGCNEDKITQNNSRTFLINLVSVLGNLSQKYIPLFLTGDLLLELEFDPTALVYGTAPAGGSQVMSISSVEYVAHCVEFGGDIVDKLRSAVMSNGLYIHLSQFRNYSTNVVAGMNNVMLQERLKSVRALLVGFNKTAITPVDRLTHRYNNTLKTFQVKVGSQYYPPQQLTADRADSTQVEMIANTFLALSEFNNIHNCPCINKEQFFKNDASTSLQVGRAIYGMDFEAFSKSSTMCGVNTVVNSPMIVQFTGDTVCQGNFFLCYDSILAIKQDGTTIMVN